MNKETKRYLREIKSLLPINGQKEKQFLEDIKSSISEVYPNLDDVTYEQLCEEIGKPTDLVINYFNEIDYSYLKKKIRISSILKRVSLVLILIIAALSIYKAVLIYDAYNKAINETITEEVVVIE